MGDPSVEDLWAGLDSFETELQGIHDAGAPQASSTLDKIDDLLRLVKEQEQALDSLPAATSPRVIEIPKSIGSVLPAIQLPKATLSPNGADRGAASSRASPRRLTPREEAVLIQTHESRVQTVRLLLISARGDSITDTQRSAIDRLLSLAKTDSDDLDELLQLAEDIKTRVNANIGAPKLLVEQQARLDSENILVLEKRLAQRLVPRRGSVTTPRGDQNTSSNTNNGDILHSNADGTHQATNELSSTELSEFEELEREAERAKVEVSSKAEFLEALASLEERSAVIMKIASGQVPLSDMQSYGASMAEKAKRNAVEADLAAVDQYVDRQKEDSEREREYTERIEHAKQQALEKARQEYQKQLEEAKRVQEEELAAVRHERAEELRRAEEAHEAELRAAKQAEQQAQAEAQQAQAQAQEAQAQVQEAISRTQVPAVIDETMLEDLKREALELARKELEADKAQAEAKAREANQARAELEAKLDAEREAQRQSQAIVEEAFRAKLLAESIAAKEESARRELEAKLASEERERDALRSKLLAGEESKRLMQARIETEAQQLHAEYLEKIEAARHSERARADAEAEEEKALLKEQLMRIKADAAVRAQENEVAMNASKAVLVQLEQQQIDTLRQLEEVRAKAESLESAKVRAAKIYASIEAEHDHISGQLEATLRQAEQVAHDERQKLHQVAVSQHGAAQAVLTASSQTATSKEQAIRSLADAKKTESMEQAEVEKLALLSAEREAIAAEKNRALETRIRLERASEQMRAQLQQPVTPRSHATSDASSDLLGASETAPLPTAPAAAAEPPTPSHPVLPTSLRNAVGVTAQTERKSSHTFHSMPKESVMPSEDLLANFSAIPATSAMPETIVAKPFTAATSSPSSASASDSANTTSSSASDSATPSATATASPVSTFTRTTTRRGSPVLGGAKIGLRRDSTDLTSVLPQLQAELSNASGSSDAVKPSGTSSPSPSRIQIITAPSPPSSITIDQASSTAPSQATLTESTEVKPPIAAAAAATAESPTKPSESKSVVSAEPFLPADVPPQPSSAASSDAPKHQEHVSEKPDAVAEIDAFIGSMKLNRPTKVPSSGSLNRSQPRMLTDLDDLLNDFASSSGESLPPPPPSEEGLNTGAAMDSVLADVEALLVNQSAGTGASASNPPVGR
jgi:hypothetical protein